MSAAPDRSQRSSSSSSAALAYRSAYASRQNWSFPETESTPYTARALGDVPLMRSIYLARRRSPGLTPAAEFVHGILRDIAADVGHAS